MLRSMLSCYKTRKTPWFHLYALLGLAGLRPTTRENRRSANISVSMIEEEIMPIVVFVTAYDEYALQAFDENALD